MNRSKLFAALIFISPLTHAGEKSVFSGVNQNVPNSQCKVSVVQAEGQFKKVSISGEYATRVDTKPLKTVARRAKLVASGLYFALWIPTPYTSTAEVAENLQDAINDREIIEETKEVTRAGKLKLKPKKQTEVTEYGVKRILLSDEDKIDSAEIKLDAENNPVAADLDVEDGTISCINLKPISN